ncbi:hypothetical protein SLEP1_g889 [Rubroshorea leprosula]|uniref:Uncharacterized protein n=1 Tax=Rubroshorea leprosula TaxID=152421 RepID=A0AAV5HKR1_9ROSI|nr:hypothetical protein SLEP1_g889 [Rubroshorea leprosula]
MEIHWRSERIKKGEGESPKGHCLLTCVSRVLQLFHASNGKLSPNSHSAVVL